MCVCVIEHAYENVLMKQGRKQASRWVGTDLSLTVISSDNVAHHSKCCSYHTLVVVPARERLVDQVLHWFSWTSTSHLLDGNLLYFLKCVQIFFLVGIARFSTHHSLSALKKVASYNTHMGELTHLLALTYTLMASGALNCLLFIQHYRISFIAIFFPLQGK